MGYVCENVGAGGAGTVAGKLRALGAQVSVLGVVGRDANGRELARILGANEVDMSGLVHSADWVTPSSPAAWVVVPLATTARIASSCRSFIPKLPSGAPAFQRVYS